MIPLVKKMFTAFLESVLLLIALGSICIGYLSGCHFHAITIDMGGKEEAATKHSTPAQPTEPELEITVP